MAVLSPDGELPTVGPWRQGGAQMRERALKVVLVLVGLLFAVGVYPVAMDLWMEMPRIPAIP